MASNLSSSKVTVQYHDPHQVYRLLEPGLISRLPLRFLHWQSHSGRPRSIDTLHIELSPAADPDFVSANPALNTRPTSDGSTYEGRNSQQIPAILDADVSRESVASARGRRHQIPGLRSTPYLKILLVRCDNSEIYKTNVRSDIKDWIKKHATPAQSTRKLDNPENHDAFEWLIIHVVVPNTAAATQPRTNSRSSDTVADRNSSIWRPGTSTLLEKLHADFDGSAKSSGERVAQIRIGINDVPYDSLPRVVPSAPTTYVETKQDVEGAWQDLIVKLKALILSSFDLRVCQYEEDIKEKDSQRMLPGWNFCTFFILKEGLARGFENVGLVEDALVGYDQLSAGLDVVVQDRQMSQSGALLEFTSELKEQVDEALSCQEVGDSSTVTSQAVTASEDENDSEPEDSMVQTNTTESIFNQKEGRKLDPIAISSTRKPYRELILASNISLFDFRCYIFARQISLLLRIGNAWSSREELLAKLKEQQRSITHGVAPLATPIQQTEEPENLQKLSEVCQRSLHFIPSISQIMREDIVAAVVQPNGHAHSSLDSAVVRSTILSQVVDNMVASFLFSVSHQILAHTSTKALIIPEPLFPYGSGDEHQASIPDPKSFLHPARSSSLRVQPSIAKQQTTPTGESFPGPFPGPYRRVSFPEQDASLPRTRFLKAGLEDLAATRAKLYMLSRNILEDAGKKRGWAVGWQDAPFIGEESIVQMQDIDLNGERNTLNDQLEEASLPPPLDGIKNRLLRTALKDKANFYRLYEILTEKALRHYLVASYSHSVEACMTDLGVLKYHCDDYTTAASYFERSTAFFGETGWSPLELSLLVMYANCLEKLRREDDYVLVVQSVISKACLAQHALPFDRAEIPSNDSSIARYGSMIKGLLSNLLITATRMSKQVHMSMADVFAYVIVDGPPRYHRGRDGFKLVLRLYSLLAEELLVDSTSICMTCLGSGSLRQIKMEQTDATEIKPGINRIELECKIVVSGKFRIDRCEFVAGPLSLIFERNANHVSGLHGVSPRSQPEDSPYNSSTKQGHHGVFNESQVLLVKPSGGLKVRISSAKEIKLGGNKPLDLELQTGWNITSKCEIRVKAATGGLRMLTTDARIVNDSIEFSKPCEVGAFFLGPLTSGRLVTLRFPYSLEQELATIAVKIDVFYSTENGSYHYSDAAFVPVSLALRVDVQDVFRHDTLLSRFNVMTAFPSPVRLLCSALHGCDVFDSKSETLSEMITIFPRAPASLMYWIKRQPGVKVGRATAKMLHLQLQYVVVQIEIESLLAEMIGEALRTHQLRHYSNLIIDMVLAEYRAKVTAADLERAALLGELPTTFLEAIKCESRFYGLGVIPGTVLDAPEMMQSFLREWQQNHQRVQLQSPTKASNVQSVLIPVAIPSVPILHTVDFQLKPAPLSVDYFAESWAESTILMLNDITPATLHLKWSRIWNTEPEPNAPVCEFSYEITAPIESWLLGGRTRGHFVIPADSGMTSTEETQAAIPLVLIPLREGLLPYPNVEIREVVEEGGRGRNGSPAAARGRICDMDFCNAAEVIRVVADRKSVIVSLDASRPGGGLMVLAIEGEAGVGSG